MLLCICKLFFPGIDFPERRRILPVKFRFFLRKLGFAAGKLRFSVRKLGFALPKLPLACKERFFVFRQFASAVGKLFCAVHQFHFGVKKFRFAVGKLLFPVFQFLPRIGKFALALDFSVLQLPSGVGKFLLGFFHYFIIADLAARSLDLFNTFADAFNQCIVCVRIRSQIACPAHFQINLCVNFRIKIFGQNISRSRKFSVSKRGIAAVKRYVQRAAARADNGKRIPF